MVQCSMKKFVYKIFFVLLLSFFSISKVKAFSYYSVSTQKFDTTLLADIEKTYATPQKIFVTQIGTKSKEPRDWQRLKKYVFRHRGVRLHCERR